MTGLFEFASQHCSRVARSQQSNLHRPEVSKASQAAPYLYSASEQKKAALSMQLAKKITLQYLRSRLKLMATFSSRKAAEKAFEIFITPHSRLDKKPAAIFEKAEKLVLDFNGLRVKGYRWNHPSPKKLLILHGYESGILK